MFFANLPLSRAFYCGLLLLASFHTSSGQRGGNETSSLQEQADFTLYTYDATASYKFLFDGAPPASPTAADLDDLLRMTEIYYKLALAGAFSKPYQDVKLVYESHEWIDTDEVVEYDTDLRVGFDVLVTLRDVGTVPTANQVLEAIVGIDANTYLTRYVARANPKEIFLWANSTEISAEIQSTGSPPPTASPVAVDVPLLNETDGEPPILATRPPTKSPTPEPTSSDTIGVIVDIVDDSDSSSNTNSPNPPNDPGAGGLQVAKAAFAEDDSNKSSARHSSIALAAGIFAAGLFL